MMAGNGYFPCWIPWQLRCSFAGVVNKEDRLVTAFTPETDPDFSRLRQSFSFHNLFRPESQSVSDDGDFARAQVGCYISLESW